MTPEKRDEIFTKVIEFELSLLKGKSKAYDVKAQEDILNAFHTVGKRIGLDTRTVIRVFIETKVLRLNSLLSGAENQYESLLDTIHDLRNYLFLFVCAISENQNTDSSSNNVGK